MRLKESLAAKLQNSGNVQCINYDVRPLIVIVPYMMNILLSAFINKETEK